MPPPGPLPSFPSAKQGRLVARYTYSLDSGAVSIPPSGQVFPSLSQKVPIGDQQGIRIVSLDAQVLATDGTEHSIELIAFGLEVDGPRATLKMYPYEGSTGVPLGVSHNAHASELDIIYWNDWQSFGGVRPNIFLVAQVTLENTDAANPHNYEIILAAVVEVYDFTLASNP